MAAAVDVLNLVKDAPLEKITNFGALGVLTWVFIKYGVPALFKREEKRDDRDAQREDGLQARLDEARKDDRELLKEVSGHIAIGNANYEAAAKRDELMISSLRDLGSAFSVFTARDDERRKRDEDMTRINNERWEKIGQQLGDINQALQKYESKQRLKKKDLAHDFAPAG